ncbi:putative mitochondrial protein, partial [Mucuna pruriens]
MEIYTNENYARSVVDRRSTFGYCMFLGGNLVTWRSKKKNVVARSSAEVEFRAMAHIQHDKTKHIEIGRHFFKEIFSLKGSK